MKLKHAHETETFINAHGLYAIKQHPDHLEEPAVIELNPDQMRSIIRDMAEHLKDQSWYSAEEEAEG